MPSPPVLVSIPLVIIITSMMMMMMAHLRATIQRWRLPSPPVLVSIPLIDGDHDKVDDDGDDDGALEDNHPEVEKAHANCYVKCSLSL